MKPNLRVPWPFYWLVGLFTVWLVTGLVLAAIAITDNLN